MTHSTRCEVGRSRSVLARVLGEEPNGVVAVRPCISGVALHAAMMHPMHRGRHGGPPRCRPPRPRRRRRASGSGDGGVRCDVGRVGGAATRPVPPARDDRVAADVAAVACRIHQRLSVELAVCGHRGHSSPAAARVRNRSWCRRRGFTRSRCDSSSHLSPIPATDGRRNAGSASV